MLFMEYSGTIHKEEDTTHYIIDNGCICTLYSATVTCCDWFLYFIVFELGPILDSLNFEPNVLPLFESASLMATLEEKFLALEDWELEPSVIPECNDAPLAPAVRGATVYPVRLDEVV